jgi:translation initiation factor IF-1
MTRPWPLRRPRPTISQVLKEAGISSKEEKVEMEGEVVEALRGRMFRVKLDNGHETIGYTAGKMKRYRIRIFLGDRVKIEVSPYDLTRGRIVYRYR